jgi:hypothetical protein
MGVNMERFKNSVSIKEVQCVLKGLQELYNEKNHDILESYIKDNFSFSEELVVLGNDMNQWCRSEAEIKELIKAQWSVENNYWKQIDFKFDDAIIYADKNTAWVISIGNITDTITEEQQLQSTINKIAEIINKEKISKEAALDVVNKIARTLRDVELGEKYVWPFRFTCVLIKENACWKFHQMQYSLDSESWNYRCIEEDYDKSLFEIPASKASVEAEEVKKVLRVFQEGYIRRDLSYVEEYMKEVFLPNGDLVVIGTDAEELCIGGAAAKQLVESDWKYWGDFKFNLEGASLSVRGEAAYFTTKALLTRTISTEKTLEWIKGGAKYLLEAKKNAKYKLIEVLQNTIELLLQNEKGELYITPMRFSGVLVKQEDKWLISHLQYSDYIGGMPQVRKISSDF